MTTTTHAAATAAAAPPAVQEPAELTLGEHLIIAARHTDPAARIVFVALVGALLTLLALLALLVPHLR